MTPVDLLEFFPFDIADGPTFLALYFVLSVVGLVATALLARARGDAVELRLAPVASSALEPTAPSAVPSIGDVVDVVGYRVAPAEVRRRLAIGSVPASDENWAIAWMRGGVASLTDALLAHAVAEGVLVPSDAPKDFDVVVRPTKDRVLSYFHVMLATAGSCVSATRARQAAYETATAVGPELAAEARAAGLERPSAAHAASRRVVLVGGALLLGIGVLRAVRGVALDHPIGYLVGLMLLDAIATMALGMVSSASVMRRRYLEWVDASTVSLRADVRSGRRTIPSEVTLAVAVEGAVRLLSSPMFAPMADVFDASSYRPAERRVVTWSGSSSSSNDPPWGGGSSSGGSSSSCSSSSSSSSSCSSSSGGGGGGCGG